MKVLFHRISSLLDPTGIFPSISPVPLDSTATPSGEPANLQQLIVANQAALLGSREAGCLTVHGTLTFYLLSVPPPVLTPSETFVATQTARCNARTTAGGSDFSNDFLSLASGRTAASLRLSPILLSFGTSKTVPKGRMKPDLLQIPAAGTCPSHSGMIATTTVIISLPLTETDLTNFHTLTLSVWKEICNTYCSYRNLQTRPSSSLATSGIYELAAYFFQRAAFNIIKDPTEPSTGLWTNPAVLPGPPPNYVARTQKSLAGLILVVNLWLRVRPVACSKQRTFLLLYLRQLFNIPPPGKLEASTQLFNCEPDDFHSSRIIVYACACRY
jgi:hypothetical protein